MNRGDGNRNRKEQQIGDQPGTPLVRCLVLEAKILNLRGKKTHGGSTGAEHRGQRSMQHSAAGSADGAGGSSTGGGRCMQRQRTGGGRRRGAEPCCLGAGGRPAQYRAHARGSCAQGAEAAPRRRKRWGQGRRRLQMQKKRGAGDRGAGVFI